MCAIEDGMGGGGGANYIMYKVPSQSFNWIYLHSPSCLHLTLFLAKLFGWLCRPWHRLLWAMQWTMWPGVWYSGGPPPVVFSTELLGWWSLAALSGWEGCFWRGRLWRSPYRLVLVVCCHSVPRLAHTVRSAEDFLLWLLVGGHSHSLCLSDHFKAHVSAAGVALQDHIYHGLLHPG